MKIVQSYLLANEAESLVHTIGFALSDNDKLTKKSADEEMMVRLGQLDSLPEAEAAVDPHVLRITAHIGIILNVLSSDMLEGDERDAEENVLVAYIQALRAARKRDLIPLYASRLQLARYVVSVSRVMQDITEVREQEQTLKLLEHYRLDVIMILKEQLAFLLNRLTSKSIDERPFVLLESTSIDTLYPGKRIIAGALPAQFTSEDEAVVQSLKWFHIMHGRWNETFQALSHALRRCLRKFLMCSSSEFIS
jgi:nuclear pore complex protein Nup107